MERTPGGFRQYSDADMEALGLICCLKNTGMPLQEIARFIALTRQGDHTLAERVEMLRSHRENVLARMKEMRKHLEKVTWKLDFFTQKLEAYQREAGKSDCGKNEHSGSVIWRFRCFKYSTILSCLD